MEDNKTNEPTFLTLTVCISLFDFFRSGKDHQSSISCRFHQNKNNLLLVLLPTQLYNANASVGQSVQLSVQHLGQQQGTQGQTVMEINPLCSSGTAIK